MMLWMDREEIRISGPMYGAVNEGIKGNFKLFVIKQT